MTEPLTSHWYAGADPPLTGVAVLVTLVPAQTGFALADIETPTGNSAFTVITTEFEIAGFPVVHPALEVNRHETTSPFSGV